MLRRYRVRRAFIVGGVGGVVAAALFYWTLNHWWLHVSPGAATVEGVTGRVELWRSFNGGLIVFPEGQSGELYVINPKRNMVGVPNHSEFVSVGPVGVTRNDPPLAVHMGGAKIERDPQLSVTASSLSFTTSDGKRVAIRY